MKNIKFSEESCIVLAGDLNVFFDTKLETKGGKPSLKQKSVSKLLERNPLSAKISKWLNT